MSEFQDYRAALLIAVAALSTAGYAQAVAAQDPASEPAAEAIAEPVAEAVEAAPEAPAAPAGAESTVTYTEPTESGGLAEIVVTATRQAQSLSKVPVSIAAFSEETIEKQGIKGIEDVARLTPGVNFSEGGLRLTSISIRGVSSPAGASTTGIYIDETPIQARLLGNSSGNTYPRIFDLERVEVLRGPQGTLFGAGAQGGAVRFITPKPSLTKYSGYMRGELSANESGDFGYESGIAFGGPIIDGTLGFRISAFHRRDAGWIDREVGEFDILSANGAAGPKDSLRFTRNGPIYENNNWRETDVVRAALAWAPTDNLVITPSVYYQEEFHNDLIQGYWPAMSDAAGGRFSAPLFVASIDDAHVPLPSDAPLFEPNRDRFTLPALLVEWDLGGVQMVANTAFFDREQTRTPDYTYTHARTYGGAERRVPLPGDKSYSIFLNTQENFTQELRFQNNDSSARFNWVAGAFYSTSKQRGDQRIPNNFYERMESIGQNGVTVTVNDGPPFGPGSTAFENFFGIGLVDGMSYIRELASKEDQFSLFGQVDFNVTEKLKLTAGLRWAESEFSYTTRYDGPSNNLNQPQGLACVPGTGKNGVPCDPVTVGEYGPGEGPFAPAFVAGSGAMKESPVTPKFGVSYQATPTDLYYLSVAKGFRTGGAQAVLPSGCYAELISYGYVDAEGNARSPDTFESDTVWSYEVGAKNRLMGGRLELASSLYYIEWENIQSTVNINSCTQSFVDNVGTATSKGGDLAVQWLATDRWQLGASVAYNSATFDDATVLGTRVLYTEGSAIPNAGSPWTVILNSQYDFELDGRESYLRLDYTYNSPYEETGATDPGSSSYDAMLSPRETTHLVNARLGTNFGNTEASLFINNLFDAHPELDLSRTRGTPVYTAYTFMPRTIGITLSKRF